MLSLCHEDQLLVSACHNMELPADYIGYRDITEASQFYDIRGALPDFPLDPSKAAVIHAACAGDTFKGIEHSLPVFLKDFITTPRALGLIHVDKLIKAHKSMAEVLFDALPREPRVAIVTLDSAAKKTEYFVRGRHARGAAIAAIKDCCLSSTITQLHRLEFTHIRVVSGVIAGRGLSFVDDNHTLHLTHVFYQPTAKKPIADTEVQAVLRCAG